MGWWESRVDTRAGAALGVTCGAHHGAISSDGSDPHSLLEQVPPEPVEWRALNLARR